MTEPYVPSGEEFDQGLRPGKRRGFGGLVDRLRNARKPKRLHSVTLRVPDHVAERTGQEPRSRPRLTPLPAPPTETPKAGGVLPPAPAAVPPFSHPTPAAVPPAASPAVPKATPAARATNRSQPRAKQQKPPPQAPPLLLEKVLAHPGLLAAHVMATAGAETRQTSLDYVGDFLARSDLDDLGTRFTRWWHACCVAPRRERTAAAHAAVALIPGDGPGDAVLRIAALPDARALPAAIALIESEGRRDKALSELRRVARSYGSWNKVLCALEVGDVELARRRVAELPGGYHGAAWQHGGNAYNAVVAATSSAPGQVSLRRLTAPRDWVNFRDEPAAAAARWTAAAALAPILRPVDALKVRNGLTKIIDQAGQALPPDEAGPTQAWLQTLAAGGTPARPARALRSPRTQPRPAPRARRPQGREAMATCAKCGVNPARPGRPCDSCADLTD